MKDRAFVSAANGAWAIVVSIALLGGFGCGSKTDSRAIYARLKSMPVNTPDGSWRSSGKGVRRAACRYRREAMTMGVNRVYQGNSGDMMEPSAWSGEVAPAGTTKASGTLTATGVIIDDETCIIDLQTYRFQDTLNQGTGVKIGVDEDETLANLQAAINREAGAGTKYATAMVKNRTVTAVATGSAIVVTSRYFGDLENDLLTTETMSNASWGAGTLLGGVTNWDVDDIMVLDGHITQEPPILNMNLRGVEIAQIRVKRSFMVDIGTESNPLSIYVNDPTNNGLDGVVQYRGEGTLYFAGRQPALTGNQNNIFCDSINTRDAIVLLGGTNLNFGSHGNIEVKNGKVHVRPNTRAFLSPNDIYVRYLVTGPNSYLVLDVDAPEADITVVDLGGTLTYGPEIAEPVMIMNGSTLIVKNSILGRVVISTNSLMIFDYQNVTPITGDRKLLMLGRGDFSRLLYGGFTVVIGPNGTLDAGPLVGSEIIDLRKDFPYGG